MNQQELRNVLEKHRKWVMGKNKAKAKIPSFLEGKYIVAENGNIYSIFHLGVVVLFILHNKRQSDGQKILLQPRQKSYLSS